MNKIALFVTTAALLAACTPASFETEPVKVETPGGTVTCQLYTKNMLDWDLSIARPDSMSVEAADSYCRQRGAEMLRGK